MPRSYSNRHHGVPRSFLGSADELVNLTTVGVQEHADFHDFAGHPPPDFFVRQAVLSLADWKQDGRLILPAGFYDEVFEVTTGKVWQELYVPGAVRSNPKGEEEKISYARAAIHICDHLSSERNAVGDAKSSAEKHTYISPALHAFREQMCAFFGEEDDPLMALRRYLTDQNADGDLKWVKPLQPAIRSRLLNVLKAEEMVKDTPAARAEVKRVMEHHRLRLNACMKNWEPNVEHYEPIILKHKSLPMFRKYLARRTTGSGSNQPKTPQAFALRQELPEAG